MKRNQDENLTPLKTTYVTDPEVLLALIPWGQCYLGPSPHSSPDPTPGAILPKALSAAPKQPSGLS